MFPFQTSTEATLMASTSACGHSDSTLNILILTHCAPQSPFIPFHFFPRLFCCPSTTCRGINRSSGGRGLGPFSKNTFEMARHVTEGYPLSCQVTPAVWASLSQRMWHKHITPDTHGIQCTQKRKHTHIHNVPSSTHAAFHAVPWKGTCWDFIGITCRYRGPSLFHRDTWKRNFLRQTERGRRAEKKAVWQQARRINHYFLGLDLSHLPL